MHLFGDGPAATLIFAGIHGDETSAVAVGQKLLDHLLETPGLVDSGTLALIPLVNPDGAAARTRVNANGVDCNRNFPASNWRKTPKGRFHAGASPASEPETLAVMKAVELFRPSRVVSIHSGLRCNNFDGPGESLAAVLAAHNGYPVQSSIGYPTPGSFGSWAGIDRAIPVATLELPRGVPGEKAWQENRDGLLAIVAGKEAPAGIVNPPAYPLQRVAPRTELLHNLPQGSDKNSPAD
jgi:protein MpaA